MTYMDYSKADKHILREDGFDSGYCGKCEAVMSQGNGYMGLRAAAEEQYTTTARGLFVAGMFDRFDDSEVSELVNAADCTGMEIMLSGERFSLDTGEVLCYERELNLKTGLLVRNIIWKSNGGNIWKLCFERFVSLKRLHDYAIRVHISLQDGSAEAQVITEGGINGQITNSGSQHFCDGDKRYYDGKYMQLVQTTRQSKISFVHNAVHTAAIIQVSDGENKCHDNCITRELKMPRRSITEKLTSIISRGDSIVLTKYCNIYTTRDLGAGSLEDIRADSLDKLKESVSIGFDELLAESIEEWNSEVWDSNTVMIESDNPLDALAMDFAMYHLRVMVPEHDNRMSIGAKGLSGEGYKGHCFWDTEVFLLPYYIYTKPETARRLLEYRYLTLDEARKKARENGYDGAMFPWESAWIDDGDVTPEYVGANVITGCPTKVWSGHIEQHITADVAYGVWQYYIATADNDFMDRYGYEIIIEAARFWSSRLEYSEADGLYHINDVIGADEYKEHCNDNSLTNYLAKWVLTKAAEYCVQLKDNNRPVYDRLNIIVDGQISLDNMASEWIKRAEHIYINEPREDGVIGQDRDYLSYPQIDMVKYKNQTRVDTILQDYDQPQLSKLQVTKQADLLVLMFMMDEMFSDDVKKACFDYYESRTTHDSSLSYCTHSVIASDVGNKTAAYDLFRKACSVDMGENMSSSDAGIHTASIGGIWQCIVMGFGGFRVTESGVRTEPALPDGWRSLQYSYLYRGKRYTVSVKRKVDGSVLCETV